MEEQREYSKRRRHTKVIKKKKDSSKNEIFDNNMNDSENKIGKKVKFVGVKIIDVESWKKINLSLTADENFDELNGFSNGYKGRIKNVGCSCIII